MEAAGDQADWFFIGTVVEAATQTVLPEASTDSASAATQTVQDAIVAATVTKAISVPGGAGFGVGYSVAAAAALAGVVGVSAGAFLMHRWKRPAAVPGTLAEPVVPETARETTTEWLQSAVPSLTAMELGLPPIPVRLEMPPPPVPPLQPPLLPVQAPVQAPVQLAPQAAAASDVPARPVEQSRFYQACAVAGLGLTALASAGLLGRWLWKRAAPGLAAQTRKVTLPVPKIEPICQPRVQERSIAQPIQQGVPIAVRMKPMALPEPAWKAVASYPPSDLSGRGGSSARLTPDLTAGGVDVGFEIMRRSTAFRKSPSCEAEVYIVDGIVRPKPPTSSHIFRVLPKQ
eukprot:TRINITY_DN81568_c0_g1_i1.p1 TRINITY_DN81568_c0_g1~~TRINITY_DN81568_c0_g1_i1.p1  ORF type:complete len:345 (+),score=68.23 TRINITY_DN81568_c0_g1_i1:174-1208(+)